MKAKITFIAISIKYDSINVSCAMMAKESHCQKVCYTFRVFTFTFLYVLISVTDMVA